MTILRTIVIAAGMLWICSSASSADQEHTLRDSLYAHALQGSSERGLEENIEAFRRVVKEDRDFAPAYHKLAMLYLLRETPDGRLLASRAIDRAIRLAPSNLDYLLARGDVIWEQGFFSRALEHYRSVLDDYPDAIEAAYRAGLIRLSYFMLRKDMLDGHGLDTFRKVFAPEEVERAIFFFNTCIKIDPMYENAVYKLGLAYYENGRFEEFVDLMTGLSDRRPESSDAKLFIALGLQSTGRLQDAQASYESALKLMKPDQRAVLESLDLVADDEEQREIRLAEGGGLSQQRGWSGSDARERFWKQHDPLFLTDYNERVMEHYARVSYANLRFGLPSEGVGGWTTDRGQTYIKFGRYRYRRSGVEEPSGFYFETWFYEGYRLRFRSPNGISGWGFETEVGVGSAAVPRSAISWVDLRASSHLDPMAQMEALFLPMPCIPGWVNEPSVFQPRGRKALETYAPRYVDPFGPSKYALPHIAAAFREEDRVRLELAYAVPVEQMKPADEGHVTFDDGVFLFDASWDELHKEVNVLRSTPDHGYITRERVVYLEPGEVNVAVEVGDHLGGGIGTFRQKRLLGFADTSLAISDLLVASRIEPLTPGAGSRAELDIQPNPRRTYRKTEPVFVYVELYNLKRDTFGKTRYEISYRFLRPGLDEIAPGMFDAEPVVAKPDAIEIHAKDLEDGTTEYFVRYILPERNRLSDGSVFREGKGRIETTVTAEYEGLTADDFTYLQIDVAKVPAGIHKLVVTARDVVTDRSVAKETLFRVIE